MGARGNVADSQRQSRLRALQCLALALLVTTQHQSPFGWIQIQPDDVPELLLKVLVGRHLERPTQMGLQVVLLPDTMNTIRRDTYIGRHAAYRPAALRPRRPRGFSDNAFDNLSGYVGGPAAAPSVLKSIDTLPLEALGPLVHARYAYAQLGGHFDLLHAGGPLQDNSRAKTIALWSRMGLDSSFQLSSLVLGKLND